MADPTLFYCIGAPKAGTTWLYDQLRRHPEIHLRAVKELHYFDTLDDGPESYNREALARKRQTLRAEAGIIGRLRPDPADRERIEDIEEWLKVTGTPDRDDRAYYGFLRGRANGAAVVGDITPCYSTLDRTVFCRMDGVAAEPRYLVLLRDPVDRLWSHVRMLAKRRVGLEENFGATCAYILRNFLRGTEPGLWKRSDYARTLTELSAAVPASRVLVMFYERLFSDEAMQELAGFLGIAAPQADFDAVSLRGASHPMNDWQRRMAAQALARQYAWCDMVWGDALPERWRENMGMI